MQGIVPVVGHQSYDVIISSWLVVERPFFLWYFTAQTLVPPWPTRKLQLRTWSNICQEIVIVRQVSSKILMFDVPSGISNWYSASYFILSIPNCQSPFWLGTIISSITRLLQPVNSFFSTRISLPYQPIIIITTQLHLLLVLFFASSYCGLDSISNPYILLIWQQLMQPHLLLTYSLESLPQRHIIVLASLGYYRVCHAHTLATANSL
jgi:hypothetical protein